MLNLRLVYDIHMIIFVQVTFVDIDNEIFSTAADSSKVLTA